MAAMEVAEVFMAEEGDFTVAGEDFTAAGEDFTAAEDFMEVAGSVEAGSTAAEVFMGAAGFTVAAVSAAEQAFAEGPSTGAFMAVEAGTDMVGVGEDGVVGAWVGA